MGEYRTEVSSPHGPEPYFFSRLINSISYWQVTSTNVWRVLNCECVRASAEPQNGTNRACVHLGLSPLHLRSLNCDQMGKALMRKWELLSVLSKKISCILVACQGKQSVLFWLVLACFWLSHNTSLDHAFGCKRCMPYSSTTDLLNSSGLFVANINKLI